MMNEGMGGEGRRGKAEFAIVLLRFPLSGRNRGIVIIGHQGRDSSSAARAEWTARNPPSCLFFTSPLAVDGDQTRRQLCWLRVYADSAVGAGESPSQAAEES